MEKWLVKRIAGSENWKPGTSTASESSKKCREQSWVAVERVPTSARCPEAQPNKIKNKGPSMFVWQQLGNADFRPVEFLRRKQ